MMFGVKSGAYWLAGVFLVAIGWAMILSVCIMALSLPVYHKPVFDRVFLEAKVPPSSVAILFFFLGTLVVMSLNMLLISVPEYWARAWQPWKLEPGLVPVRGRWTKVPFLCAKLTTSHHSKGEEAHSTPASSLKGYPSKDCEGF
jgi:hypothetical protein